MYSGTLAALKHAMREVVVGECAAGDVDRLTIPGAVDARAQ